MNNRDARFKLNIMNAFKEDEQRQLQKSVWDAMIDYELPEPEVKTREVSPIAQALPEPAAQAAIAAPVPAAEPEKVEAAQPVFAEEVPETDTEPKE
jgi:hypothetical protein